jgi:hypothetical protein
VKAGRFNWAYASIFKCTPFVLAWERKAGAWRVIQAKLSAKRHAPGWSLALPGVDVRDASSRLLNQIALLVA